MFRKLIYLVSFALVSGVFLGVSNADIETGLMGYWPLDEGAGTTTADASGNSHNGTFTEGTPDWVEGKFGNALKFSGSNKVEIPDHADFHLQDAVSVALWAQPGGGQLEDAKFFVKQKTGQYPYGLQYSGNSQTIFATVNASARFDTTPKLPNFEGQWAHLCFTYDGAAVILYKNGQEVARIAASGKLQQNNLALSIGGRLGSSQNFTGVIDDVRLYNRTLTQAEIMQIMQGPPLGPASDPSPAAGAEDAPRDAVLSWTPGANVSKHDVYFGANFGDVEQASTTTGSSGVYKGRIDPNFYDVGRLEFGRTYYWRIDEIEAPPNNTIHKGGLWSFTVEPLAYVVKNIIATASSTAGSGFGPENTINGSGLNANDLHSVNVMDMWLSGSEPQGAWIQYELDAVYSLHQMWVWNGNQAFEGLYGFGLKTVAVEYSTNGTDWTALAGVPEFTKAPGTADYAHNTTVDFGGVAAKYVKLTATSNWGGILPQYNLSEVRFFSIPVSARDPNPASGATDVDVDGILAWRAGREAAMHKVYLSTDQQAVTDGTAAAVSAAKASYSASLDLGNTYYWRIDEVNDLETPATWQGDVWSFSTSEYLVVEDFESYNDVDPPDPKSNRIFDKWIDGFAVAANGALVGYDPPQPSYAEKTIVHGGKQAMPLFYSNTAGATFSEAVRTFASPQDWTKHGVKTLVLYFHGAAGSTGQLYAKINSAKVLYAGNAADITRPRWTQWNIDLASLGIALQNVTTLALGIDGNGAAGTLYVDDIVLYRLAPEVAVSSEEIWIEAEATASITAPMKVYDDPTASGGKYISTDESVGDNNTDPPADGIASYTFTVLGGTYKISGRLRAPGASNSFWVRVPGATTPAETELHSSGWVRWNDPPAADNWFWSDVFSDDDDQNAVVLFTMNPGTYTLEIARREDGTQLDAIVISKVN